MDFHGNINLKSNEMQNLVFQQESGFPVDAVVGSVVFNDKVLYMAVAVGNDTNPIWIPLTTSIDTYVHDQTAAATTWTVTHSLGSDAPIVQIYDANNEMIIPDAITPTNASTLDVSFSNATTGRAVIMHGDEVPANGIGILTPAEYELLLTLDNPNVFGTSLSDGFAGSSIAMTNDHIVAGAPQEDESGLTSTGTVYIFDTNTGALLHTLSNPNAYGTGDNDRFGRVVAISGDNVVISTLSEISPTGDPNSGIVYIFSATSGLLLHTIDNPNIVGPDASDVFGTSIGVSTTQLVVGAPGESSGVDSGRVYVFDLATAALIQTFTNPDPFDSGSGDSDGFGNTVAISSNKIIVGANLEDAPGSISGTGKAYVFDIGTANLLLTIVNPNAFGTEASDQLGTDLALSDTHIVAGVKNEDDATGNNSGKVYIFDAITGTLLHTLDNPNTTGTGGDKFGDNIAISGDNLVVGVNLIGATNDGIAYLYSLSTGALINTFDNPSAFGTVGGDSFGSHVAITSSKVVIAANGEDDASGTNSGKAYIFSV